MRTRMSRLVYFVCLLTLLWAHLLRSYAQQGWNVELVGFMVGVVYDVHVEGRYAYCAKGAGLVILDVSDPTAPARVGQAFSGSALDVQVSGGYAYVADDWAGLRVIDISNPRQPQEVGYWETPDSASGVHVSGGYAYVAAEEAGLFILRFTAYSVRGQVALQDYGGDVSRVPVTVELRQGGVVVRTETVPLDAQGRYRLTGVAPGTYDLAFKASHWLRRVAPGVVVVDSDVDGVDVSLVNGDVDGDNEVTLWDFGALVVAFGTVPGDSSWNADAYLDGDEEVTLWDFNILVRNFGAIGED